MYNIIALPMKQSDMDEGLSSAHRAHLQRALGIFYPLSNEVKAEDIYINTGQRPLEVDIVHQRWAILGHVLRRDDPTAANRAMQMCLEEKTVSREVTQARK